MLLLLWVAQWNVLSGPRMSVQPRLWTSSQDGAVSVLPHRHVQQGEDLCLLPWYPLSEPTCSHSILPMVGCAVLRSVCLYVCRSVCMSVCSWAYLNTHCWNFRLFVHVTCGHGGMLAWLCVWGEVQMCIWPSWRHCHSLSLAPVNPDWFYLSGAGSPG